MPSFGNQQYFGRLGVGVCVSGFSTSLYVLCLCVFVWLSVQWRHYAKQGVGLLLLASARHYHQMTDRCYYVPIVVAPDGKTHTNTHACLLRG